MLCCELPNERYIIIWYISFRVIVQFFHGIIENFTKTKTQQFFDVWKGFCFVMFAVCSQSASSFIISSADWLNSELVLSNITFLEMPNFLVIVILILMTLVGKYALKKSFSSKKTQVVRSNLSDHIVICLAYYQSYEFFKLFSK